LGEEYRSFSSSLMQSPPFPRGQNY
jgi:hypothetical protein